jgi:Secretion system C-terminal sorting domain/Domain of unknown function (DUF362)
MKEFITRYVKICPKTYRFRGFRPVNGLTKLILPIVGLLAFLWIISRVITKPSRINYPCVKAAMPFAAGFLQNIIVFLVSLFAFGRIKKVTFKNQFILAALLVTFTVGGTYLTDNDPSAYKFPTIYQEPNEPMGIAQGIFPGRVVWMHDPDATNEDCSPNEYGDGWFLEKNNNQDVIDEMLSTGLKSLTGTASDAEAWDSIFIFHNRNVGKGNIGYKTGEKIFIKINIVSGWGGNYNPTDLSKVNNSSYGISESSPQMVLAVLRQLVDTAGVPQDDIYIGDPLRHIYKHLYDYWHPEFPDVHYMDHNGYTNLGREVLVPSDSAKIEYSDRGKILRTNVWDSSRPGNDPVTEDHFYTIYDEADYILGLPMLKGHKRAGMTAFAKNHFGSHTREDASHLHNGLVAPTELPNVTRPGYGLYRVQVDIMGDEILGKKNLVYILDALWTADQEISYPKKFQMAPFNNDWMSSIFLSLDPVAIESVGYDFLRAEFTVDRPDVGDGAGTYVQMDGVNDYLQQAADPANWPDSILGADGKYYPFAGYDPENDGTVIASLGTNEHWNNDLDKQYSRNLGTGNGIELYEPSIVSVKNTSPEVPSDFVLHQNYPNPFNPSTTINFSLMKAANVELNVYDVMGKLVDVIIKSEFKPVGTYKVRYNAEKLSSGVYFAYLKAGSFNKTIKMILMK